VDDMLFAPDEFFWVMRPTLGYLFGKNPSHTHLLLALRWEQTNTSKTDLTRDTIGFVWLWKVPSHWMSWGSPVVSGFGGAHIRHPNRDQMTPYFGTQMTVNFKSGK
jgi:hypothetical protein